MELICYVFFVSFYQFDQSSSSAYFAYTVSERIRDVIEASRMPASLNIEVMFRASSLSVLCSFSEDLIK